MHTVAIRLDPSRLENPDLDIRYDLPDLLVARSAGAISDDGYDYVGETPYLVLFLAVADLDVGLPLIETVIRTESVLDNALADVVVVAVQEGEDYRVVYPPHHRGGFYDAEN